MLPCRSADVVCMMTILATWFALSICVTFTIGFLVHPTTAE